MFNRIRSAASAVKEGLKEQFRKLRAFCYRRKTFVFVIKQVVWVFRQIAKHSVGIWQVVRFATLAYFFLVYAYLILVLIYVGLYAWAFIYLLLALWVISTLNSIFKHIVNTARWNQARGYSYYQAGFGGAYNTNTRESRETPEQDRINKLRRKAASSTYQPETEAFNAKADELTKKYRAQGFKIRTA